MMVDSRNNNNNDDNNKKITVHESKGLNASHVEIGKECVEKQPIEDRSTSDGKAGCGKNELSKPENKKLEKKSRSRRRLLDERAAMNDATAIISNKPKRKDSREREKKSKSETTENAEAGGSVSVPRKSKSKSNSKECKETLDKSKVEKEKKAKPKHEKKSKSKKVVAKEGIPDEDDEGKLETKTKPKSKASLKTFVPHEEKSVEGDKPEQVSVAVSSNQNEGQDKKSKPRSQLDNESVSKTPSKRREQPKNTRSREKKSLPKPRRLDQQKTEDDSVSSLQDTKARSERTKVHDKSKKRGSLKKSQDNKSRRRNSGKSDCTQGEEKDSSLKVMDQDTLPSSPSNSLVSILSKSNQDYTTFERRSSCVQEPTKDIISDALLLMSRSHSDELESNTYDSPMDDDDDDLFLLPEETDALHNSSSIIEGPKQKISHLTTRQYESDPEGVLFGREKRTKSSRKKLKKRGKAQKHDATNALQRVGKQLSSKKTFQEEFFLEDHSDYTSDEHANDKTTTNAPPCARKQPPQEQTTFREDFFFLEDCSEELSNDKATNDSQVMEQSLLDENDMNLLHNSLQRLTREDRLVHASPAHVGGTDSCDEFLEFIPSTISYKEGASGPLSKVSGSEDKAVVSNWMRVMDRISKHKQSHGETSDATNIDEAVKKSPKSKWKTKLANFVHSRDGYMQQSESLNEGSNQTSAKGIIFRGDRCSDEFSDDDSLSLSSSQRSYTETSALDDSFSSLSSLPYKISHVDQTETTFTCTDLSNSEFFGSSEFDGGEFDFNEIISASQAGATTDGGKEEVEKCQFERNQQKQLSPPPMRGAEKSRTSLSNARVPVRRTDSSDEKLEFETIAKEEDREDKLQEKKDENSSKKQQIQQNVTENDKRQNKDFIAKKPSRQPEELSTFDSGGVKVIDSLSEKPGCYLPAGIMHMPATRQTSRGRKKSVLKSLAATKTRAKKSGSSSMSTEEMDDKIQQTREAISKISKRASNLVPAMSLPDIMQKVEELDLHLKRLKKEIR